MKAFIGIALLALTATDTLSQPLLQIPHTTQVFTIDGNLNEPAWSSAGTIDSFIHRTGGTGKVYKTTVQALWTGTDLWFGVTAKDSSITVKQAACEPCGPTTWREGDDIFEIHFSPDTAAPYGILAWETDLIQCENQYARRATPDSGQSVTQNGTNTNCWNAAVTFASQTRGTVNNSADRDTGWTMEIRIPFSSFQTWPAGGLTMPAGWNPASPPQAGAVWLMDFTRSDIHTVDGRTSVSTRWYDQGYGFGNHNFLNFGRVQFVNTITARELSAAPGLRMAQVRPNPFGKSARLEWNFPGEKALAITIFDLQGRRLWRQPAGPGTGSQAWPKGPGLDHSGIYAVRWSAGARKLKSIKVFRQ
jgi:hypothetical protein